MFGLEQVNGANMLPLSTADTKQGELSNIKEALALKDQADTKLAESFSGNEYGDKNLLEETSRALDVAAGNQEQSPMVVLMASNRSHLSCG